MCLAASVSSAGSTKHIRAESPFLRRTVDESIAYSPTLAAIAERIEHSNVIVHVTCGYWNTLTLAGRTLWVSANADVRYLRVQVDCLLARPGLIAILGHELTHVSEVAAAPGVVDEQSFRHLFTAIGFSTCDCRDRFETDAAAAAGERVREDMLERGRVTRSRLVLTRINP